MGLAEFFSDLYESLPSWPEAHAEAPANDEEESEESEEKEEKSDDAEEGEGEGEGESEESEEAEEGGDDEEEEEEEEEEEDEPVDPKPQLEEECARSAACLPYKHHYQECVERVTAQHEDENYKGPKEDCVEEFFHLQHCATQCAAPRLFKILK